MVDLASLTFGNDMTRSLPFVLFCYAALAGCVSASHRASTNQPAGTAKDTFVIQAAGPAEGTFIIQVSGAASGEFRGHATARITRGAIMVTLIGSQPPLHQVEFGLTPSNMRSTKITLIPESGLSLPGKWHQPGFGWADIFLSPFGLYLMHTGSVVIDSISADHVVGSFSAYAPYSLNEATKAYEARADSVSGTPLKVQGRFSAEVTAADSTIVAPGGE